MTDEIPAANQFREWAKAAEGTAFQRHKAGDGFGARLARARAEAYRHAAIMADQQHSEAVAQALVRLIRQHATRDLIRLGPLPQIDAVAISYVTARAYQLCAQTLDPSVPELQPRWD